MKYLKQRAGWFHFERVVPKDLQRTIGKKAWREALDTDSKVEAEVRCRRRTVETDDILKQAKDGTYRQVSDHDIAVVAAQWSVDFQLINRENIALDAFTDVWGDHEKIGDEAPNPIFRSKSELEQSVGAWLARIQCYDVNERSPDWDVLVDACLDEYLVSNPEISSAWVQIHSERGIRPMPDMENVFNTVVRSKRVAPENKLTAVFQRYLTINRELGDSAKSDFGTSVRRFVEFHGDVDVTEITRTHVEQFRDAVVLLPVRPPNRIRSLPMKKQIAWAEENTSKRLEQGTINKNLMGVKRTLDFAFARNWTVPRPQLEKSMRRILEICRKAKEPDQGLHTRAAWNGVFFRDIQDEVSGKVLDTSCLILYGGKA